MVEGESGLCLLASTRFTPANQFVVYPASAAGILSGEGLPVPYNEFLPLAPGRYRLASDVGGFVMKRTLAIRADALSTVRTGTIRFDTGSRSYRLGYGQSEDSGCGAAIGRATLAVLAGAYRADFAGRNNGATSDCFGKGTVPLVIFAGETLLAGRTKVTRQRLAEQHIFRHPDTVSSLASMSSFTADIQTLGYLPGWESLDGIHNSYGRRYDALVLSGIGSHRFLVPFIFRERQRECGHSLAKGGSPARVLLTDCVFHGEALTHFRVNPGSYYTLNNRRGHTVIEGNYLNNAILVTGVNFVRQPKRPKRPKRPNER